MKRIVHAVALLCLAWLGLGGCASIVVTPPAMAGPPKPTGTWRAGAAKSDLTPVPGFPMGGHSLIGKVSRGYWTRLTAHAIYLEDPEGRRLALVSCDLWSMPAGLADRVAELVATGSDGRRRPPDQVPLARDQIILAATHTHQSPGNFSSSSGYNTFASPRPGFDRRLFEFLAHRIADAIIAATLAARPAVVTYGEGPVAGLARNRSFPPFLRNTPEAAALLAENAWLPEADVPGEYGPPPTTYTDGIIYHAVSPRLSVLSMRARDEPDKVIALAAFVAAHPTSISHRTPLYSGDLFGVAAVLAERTLRNAPSAGSPVVAIFNGAEGDVSPAWQCRDPRNADTCQERVDALALGRILGQRILEVSAGGRTISGGIAHRYGRGFELAGQCLTDDPSRCTAKQPMIGVAMVGGTPDGRSDGYNLGWRDGMAGPDKSAQGSKLPALDPSFVPVDSPVGVSRFVMDVLSTPSRLPLGVYQIGPLLLATLPGEFTTVMGVRIQNALAQAMAAQGKPVERVILVGLANEYLSYFTTPEEYALQFYEGASTAYGPVSGPLVQDRLTLLARQFSEAPAPRPETIEYSPGPPVQFGLCDVGTPAPSREGLAGILQDDGGRPLPDAPTFCWSDRFPILPLPYDPARRVTPRAAIEVRRGAGSWAVLRATDGDPENDRGLNFVTTASATFPLRSEWCVTWLGRLPAGSDLEARFNVTTLRGETLHAPVKPFAPPP